MKKKDAQNKHRPFPKTLSGIEGLDEITQGGIPKNRPSLIYGNAGCGKTIFSLQFIVKGAAEYNEPGVFVSFEETEEELITNARSLNFDLDNLVSQRKILIDHVSVERHEIEETGEYNLEGLFIRLNHAIDSIGAKRVVLDTIESLFSGLPNALIVRSELRRFCRWLKEKKVTAIITGERGNTTLTHQGIEEFVSDCVIRLENRITEQTSSRRLRVIKYRGSNHESSEFPFLINQTGICILPGSSFTTTTSTTTTTEQISSGIPRLDAMLGKKGFFRGSTILASGPAGTGKSSIAAHFTEAACKRGERVIYFALEESPSQIVRNMRSIGIDLKKWEDKGILTFHYNRPTYNSLDSYLTAIYAELRNIDPQIVVFDPISSFMLDSNQNEAKAMIMRLVDILKSNKITSFMTSLTSDNSDLEHTSVNISSLIDTWLLLRDMEFEGERNRGIHILKSRGMAHSKQIREFILTDHGAELLDVYIGSEGVLTGSARLSREAKETAEQLEQVQGIERKQIEIERKRNALQAQIASLQGAFKEEEDETLRLIELENLKMELAVKSKLALAKSRQKDTVKEPDSSNKKI